MFFDVHAHLDMINEDEKETVTNQTDYVKIEQIIKEAKEKNVNEIISCSTSFESNKKNIMLSKKFDEVKCAIGLYPLNLIELTNEEIDKAFDFFEDELKTNKNIIAIGEVGLDYKYSKSEEEKDKQKKAFIRFITLAKKFDKPLIIHSRYAQRDVLNILVQQDAKKVLLHGFIDSPSLIKQAIDKDYFISVGPILIYNQEIQNRLKEINYTNILFETDSPIKFNGEENYSKKIVEIAVKLSEIKQISLKEIEEKQESNYLKLFK
ncbi:MAG: TatD family hydrolase [Candidatus ainarchaeum sp.]|nr:TatD family hydrolase [Candidatus ainarchaeum sp.]